MHKKASGSVSKKTNNKFRHAGRLLRNGLNFVFLRGKMYIGTSTEQKTKNTKMAWIRCPSHFSNPSVSAKALPPPFTQRRRKAVKFLILCVVQPTLSTVCPMHKKASGFFILFHILKHHSANAEAQSFAPALKRRK